MSKESAIAFVEKTSSDVRLQNRVAALGPNDAAGLVEIAASAGYSLSVGDLRGILSEKEASGGLSDGALESVSGGRGYDSVDTLTQNAQGFLRLNPGLLRGIIFVGRRNAYPIGPIGGRNA